MIIRRKKGCIESFVSPTKIHSFEAVKIEDYGLKESGLLD